MLDLNWLSAFFNVGGAETNARGSIINFQMGGHISSAKFVGYNTLVTLTTNPTMALDTSSQ